MRKVLILLFILCFSAASAQTVKKSRYPTYYPNGSGNFTNVGTLIPNSLATLGIRNLPFYAAYLDSMIVNDTEIKLLTFTRASGGIATVDSLYVTDSDFQYVAVDTLYSSILLLDMKPVILDHILPASATMSIGTYYKKIPFIYVDEMYGDEVDFDKGDIAEFESEKITTDSLYATDSDFQYVRADTIYPALLTLDTKTAILDHVVPNSPLVMFGSADKPFYEVNAEYLVGVNRADSIRKYYAPFNGVNEFPTGKDSINIPGANKPLTSENYIEFEGQDLATMQVAQCSFNATALYWSSLLKRVEFRYLSSDDDTSNCYVDIEIWNVTTGVQMYSSGKIATTYPIAENLSTATFLSDALKFYDDLAIKFFVGVSSNEYVQLMTVTLVYGD